MSHKRKRSHHSKNILNKTMNKSVSLVKSTSKKYMPKVKGGLENVGSKVIRTSKKSVPFLQKITRKVFGMFGIKNKSRKYKR